MKAYSRICARIDLDAVEYNIESMKKSLGEHVRMLVVVKTDGYGHGALQIAKVLERKEYIWGYATATFEEAVLLKKGGIRKPLLVLGCIFPDQRKEAAEQGIRMTVYDEETAKELSKLAESLRKKVYVHIKVDTGMSRIGFPAAPEGADIIEKISRMPGLMMEGMYTHFAKADETDKTFTGQQLEKFLYMKGILEERSVGFPIYHCSNSAGIIDCPDANLNLVRAGIATYGLYPSGEVKKENVPLMPAMELVSHVVYVKTVEAGTPVSYGGTFVTDRKTRIATIPVGYGDGYPRSLSNRGHVLIRGRKAPILGRVCMDQFMVDVTDIPDVSFGDRVTLVGKDGDESLTVEELEELSGRFNYELICALGKRIPREYLRNGKVTEQVDYFS